MRFINKKLFGERSFLAGFTLIEIAVVLIIIGVTATLAVSQWMGWRGKALKKEAYSNLKRMREMEKEIKLKNGSYADCNFGACEAALGLDLPDKTWRYRVQTFAGGDAMCFCSPSATQCTVAIARGNGGTWGDCRYVVDFNCAGEAQPSHIGAPDCP